MFIRKVSQFIEEKHLLGSGDKVLVALSGGADSVALLRVLLRLGYACEAAHCNFHLRGEESVRDERFVRALAERLGVPLHVIHFDTNAYAASHNVSVEMAARELRYDWFAKVRQECGAKVVAVAHHRDDSVETFLLNLLRGTGINGLQGIRPRNGYIIRPLLCLNRQEIITYLATLKQNYVTDSTNLEDTYMRNKIRLHLLPLMQQITPAAKENLLKTAVHLTDAALLYQQAVNEGRKRILLDGGKAIDIKALLHEPAPNTLLFEVLHPLGFNESQIENIYRSLQSQPGKKFSTGKWTVIKDRDQLLIIEEQQKNIPPVLDIQTYDYTPDFNIPHDKHSAAFDTGKLLHPLSLRLWQQGDSFVPFGMKGTKKVSDYLTDRKFSLAQKEQQWVLCCGEDIIWLVGERSDNRFRVNDATQSITIVTLRQPNE